MEGLQMKVFFESIVSSFHDDDRIDMTTEKFNSRLKESLSNLGIVTTTREEADILIYYIKSGGTENIFKSRFKPQAINLLLTTDMHNSLPAALEIHSYLTNEGLNTEILHGDPELIAKRIQFYT